MPQKDDHFYAEETQQIMGSIPSWIIRRGIIVIFLIFLSLFAGSYFIKYPRKITGTISITTINVPADIVTKYTGTIQLLLAENGTKLREGDIVAVLSTPADYKDVLKAESLLHAKTENLCKRLINEKSLHREYKLGELQPLWAEFTKEIKAYQDYLEINYTGKKKYLLESRIAKNNEYYLKQRKQQSYIRQDLSFGKKNVERDSVLLANEAISRSDYETTQREFIAKKNEEAGFESALISTELAILQMKQEIVELSLQQHNEQKEYERKIEQLGKQMLSQIEQWKSQYLLTAPVSGCLSLADYRKGQYITSGETFATVIPEGDLKIVGRMNVTSGGFGQVEKGQTVNIKLNGFPYMEFGILKGKVALISATPKKNEQGLFYLVEINFPNGLVTTYHKKLPMIQAMDGTGEIVTKDMRLSEQFTQPIQSAFKNE